MYLLGSIILEREVKNVDSKYSISFSDESVKRNKTRLTNQLWKCIPMRENEEDWKKQMNSVIIEVVGLAEIFSNEKLLQILTKLEGLCLKDCGFDIYRKTIFECLTILNES